MAAYTLLIHRHQFRHGQVTRVALQTAQQGAMALSELAGHCHCPLEALSFTRVGPVHLAHGGAWARLEALDSLRWPLLDGPVIHGPAVAVRPVLGGDGPDLLPGSWRALREWEATNALWVLQRYAEPLLPLSCPVDQAFLWNLGWPLHGDYRQAQQAGDVGAMLRIRLQVLQERRVQARVGWRA